MTHKEHDEGKRGQERTIIKEGVREICMEMYHEIENPYHEKEYRLLIGQTWMQTVWYMPAQEDVEPQTTSLCGERMEYKRSW